MPCPGDKFVTQIIYRKGAEEYPVGFIAAYGGLDGLHNYHWSVKGKRWSRKWLTHTEAIEALLLKAGLTRLDTYHIIPIPETWRKNWHTVE